MHIPIYMRHFPISAPRTLSREDWLRYHFENHLQEIYIFRGRCLSLLTLIRRAYKRDANQRVVDEVCDRTDEVLTSALDDILKTRGAHVHERRYEDTDSRNLSTFGILSKNGQPWARLYKKYFHVIRTEKRLQMRKNNFALRSLLDQYCAALGALLFKADGHFKPPVLP